MSYKPVYCCQCREKIERKVWRPWTSGRFCELCETNFGIYDKIKNAALIFFVLLSVVGVSNMLKTPRKELAISSNQLTGNFNYSKKETAAQQSPTSASNQHGQRNVSPNNTPDSLRQPKQTISQLNFKQANNQFEKSSADPIDSPVFFCGAQTKKGTPCTRRVKKPERCWQHAGQTAMLPQQKLLAKQ